MAYIQVVGGLVLLVVAGDFLVRGAVSMAGRLGIPQLAIAATVVAFGTSAPELVVGVDAVLSGVPTLALGNVVGSNIANVLIVVGLPALIYPMTCTAPRLTRNMVIMLAATSVFIYMAFQGAFERQDGILLVIGLISFLAYSTLRGRTPGQTNCAEEAMMDFDMVGVEKEEPVWLSTVFVLFGLFGLGFGAHFLIEGSVVVAREWGVSEAVIGLTLVALGTSLPELVTAMVAAFRNHCDVAVGNVIGSNIFNLLGIIGISSLVGDIPVPTAFLELDLWVMFGASLALLPFAIFKARIGRIVGFIFLISYVTYIYMLASGVGAGAAAMNMT